MPIESAAPNPAVPVLRRPSVDGHGQASRFATDGFIDAIDFLSAAECSLLNRYFDDKERPTPVDWVKGHVASDRVIYDIATRPQLTSVLEELLGPNVILWGASVVDRAPGEGHPWHTDIESSAPDSRCANVWIGLENTSIESSLKLIRGSHRIGKPLQLVAAARGVPRDDRSTEVALECALSCLGEAGLVDPDLQNGQALFFDGRLWHGSLNTRASGRRRALLLQYAAAEVPIRMPDFRHLDWPFVFLSTPLPPAIAVTGKANRRINRIANPPARSRERLSPLNLLARPIPSPLARDPKRGWRPHPQFGGSTPVLGKIECHVSVLDPGHSPHRPHAHLDEEILIVLDGHAEVLIASHPDDPAPRVEVLDPGDFIYYPSYQFHTIRCPGPTPVSYLMFRWHGALVGSAEPLQTSIFRDDIANALHDIAGRSSVLVFEAPTAFLQKLHCHRSRVPRNTGYAPHQDKHDGALVLLRGRFRTGGRTVRAPAVVFQAAGEWHGMLGVGEEPAEYIVLEWHAPHTATSPFHRALLQTLLGHVFSFRIRAGRKLAAIRRLIRPA